MAANVSGTPTAAFGRKVIHGALIQAGTITAALAQLDTACVQTANIDDLNVTTIKIANNAVTIPVSAYTSGAVNLATAGSYTNVQSLSISPESSNVIVVFSCAVYNSLGSSSTTISGIRIRRDAVTIYEDTNVKGPMAANEGLSIALNVEDTPGASTYTYYADIKPTGGGILSAANRSLYSQGVKK